jgi:hypothetical protein
VLLGQETASIPPPAASRRTLCNIKNGKMKTTLTTLTLIIFSLLTHAGIPRNEYHFNDHPIEKLIPFSKEEQSLFKQKGIKKIVQIFSNDNIRRIYYFNDAGLLTNEDKIKVKGEKQNVIESTKYNYSQNGLIISKCIKTKYMIFFDSVAYDGKNRIIYYYSYNEWLSKKHNEKNVRNNFVLLYSYTDWNILIDNSDSNNIKLRYFDNNNTIIKSITHYQTDSISFETTPNSDIIKKYWYKRPQDSIYKIGIEELIIKGKTQYENFYCDYGPYGLAYKRTSNYDTDGRLIMITNIDRFNDHRVFIYDQDGLKQRVYDIMGKNLYCAEYYYRN